MEHINQKSCLELKTLNKLVNESVKTFEGRSELDRSFDHSIYFYDWFFYGWHDKNLKDIPNWLGCLAFIKEGVVTIMLKRKLNFGSNFSNDKTATILRK